MRKKDLLQSEIPEGADRINDVVQREWALSKADVTRLKVCQKINLLLEATKMVKVGCSATGQDLYEEQPDKESIARGIEYAGRMLGDFKDTVNVGVGVSVQLTQGEQEELARLRGAISAKVG